METKTSIQESKNTKIKVMSDSVTKYYEMQEENLTAPNTQERRASYTELELVETVVKLARQYKESTPSLLLQLAKDELNI